MHIELKTRRLAIQLLALTSFVVFFAFSWQGNKGFSLWDEGYLWYGVQRAMLGEVPIRDFMAYDLGRYYWSAALMSLWKDNGIIALRVTAAIFQFLGLLTALFLIARVQKKHSFSYLFLAAITLMAWMLPRHKFFDISLSILLMGVLVFLIEKPTNRRYFLAGLCVGLVAIFGRNHGMYGVAASIGVILWLRIQRVESGSLLKNLSIWATGIVVGYTPMLAMLLLVPDFAGAFVKSILFLFELKGTNLPLPVPWPWRVSFESMPMGDAIRGVLIGMFFIALIVLGLLSLVWVIRQRLQNRHVGPELAAASFLALPYAHYAYSRADVAHLSQGIFPLLVGCMVVLATQPAKIKWISGVVLCTVTLYVTYVFQPGWQCHVPKQCVNIEVSGNTLWVDPGTAYEVNLLRKMTDQYASDGQSFIAAPFWPGAYALLERRSPLWEIYATVPRSRDFQEAEIERLRREKPRFALILDVALDGRDELRYKNSHPLCYQYIQDSFERLPALENPAYQIYGPKERN